MDSGDLLAQAFADYGVRYVFGIPGGQTLPLYDAIARTNGKVRHILIRDERSGPYAADAYARVTGHLAACDAVPGPGVVKLPSGLAEAHTTAVPLIAIAGDLPREFERYRRHAAAAQGLCDQVELLRPVSKAVIRVHSQIDLRDGINRAFAEATASRPGPVVLNVPADIMHADWDPAKLPINADDRFATFPAVRVRPPAEDVERAADLLGHAERPVMVVGGGGLLSRAFEEVQGAAERFALPVASTVSGKGIIGEYHHLSIGVLGGQYGEPGANSVVEEADLIFLVGFKSSQQSTYAWKLPRPDQKVIHLDIDPYEIGKAFKTEVGLVGDAAAGLAELLAASGSSELLATRGDWLKRAAELRNAWRDTSAREVVPRTPILPQYLMGELERLMHPTDILVSDASFSIGWIASWFHVQRAGRVCLFPRGSATLGFGLPAAIGASLAARDRRTFCVAGDGGIAYALGELGTCRKYQLPIVLIVLNNSCLGYSKWVEKLGQQNYENVDYEPTDFAQIAQGFGCHGVRVETPDQFGDAVAEAVKTEGTTLIDTVVDQWATPELMLRKHWTVPRSDGESTGKVWPSIG
jgi:acetolactate synthase I/II/III large subunit